MNKGSQNGEFRSAMLSECGTYRYTLGRIWDFDKPRMLFIMLNPSTADAHQDDPTIRRCRMFAQREGFGGLFVGNLFAFRATSPKVLRDHWIKGSDVVDPDNDSSLDHLRHLCTLTVFAWGTVGGELGGRADHVMRKYSDASVFGFTGNGQPKHPLYLSKHTPLIQTRRSLSLI